MSLYKTWKCPIAKTHSLQFRWDVFNVTNLTRFNAQSVGSSALLTSLTQSPNNFGAYTSLLTQPRVMQFALRYESRQMDTFCCGSPINLRRICSTHITASAIAQACRQEKGMRKSGCP